MSGTERAVLKSKLSKVGSLESGDMHLQEDPLAQGHPALEKSDVWEDEGGADDNRCYGNVGKKIKIGDTITPKHSNAPQLNSDGCDTSDPSDNQQDDQVKERVRSLVKADDQQNYGEGRSTVDQIRILISVTGSETLLWEESKLMQPNTRTSPENEIQIQLNHDIHPPAQAHPSPSKPDVQAMALEFGDFDARGEDCYTQSFVNARKCIDDGHTVIPKPSSDASQLNCDVIEPPADEQVSSPEVSEPSTNRRTSQQSRVGSSSTKDCGHGTRRRSKLSLSYCRGGKDFIEPVNNAKFPLLDEDLIDERGRPLLPDYGGGRRLTTNQSGNNGVASRGFPISISLQTESNPMQPKVEETSEPTNDHPNKVKKNGSWFSCFGVGSKKTTNQNNKRERNK